MRRQAVLLAALLLCSCAAPGLHIPPGSTIAIQVPPTAPDLYPVKINPANSGIPVMDVIVNSIAAAESGSGPGSRTSRFSFMLHGRPDYENLYAAYLLGVQAKLTAAGDHVTLIDRLGRPLVADTGSRGGTTPVALMVDPAAPAMQKSDWELSIDTLSIGYTAPTLATPYMALAVGRLNVLHGPKHDPILLAALVSKPAKYRFFTFDALMANRDTAIPALHLVTDLFTQSTVDVIERQQGR